MKIKIYIGGVVSAFADGKLLSRIPPFIEGILPRGPGKYEIDTQEMPPKEREEYEKAIAEYILD